MLSQGPRNLSVKKVPRPDVVMAVGSIVELLAVYFAPALRRASKIVWLRTILVDEKATRLPSPVRFLLRMIEIPLLRSADLLIANGEDTAHYYRTRGLTVTANPNGVDVDRWKCAPPTFSGPLRIAFVGRLIVEKGLPEFIGLARELSGWRLSHVVGEGPLDDDVQRASRDHVLINHGRRPNAEILQLLAGVDVCVGFSLKVAEEASPMHC